MSPDQSLPSTIGLARDDRVPAWSSPSKAEDSEHSLPEVTTLAERKVAEARRRKRAADEAVRALRDYARRHHGRFVIFGSYARDAIGFDSDLDILVDFPPERVAEAWHFAETTGADRALPVDLHDARTTTAAFLERVARSGIELA